MDLAGEDSEIKAHTDNNTGRLVAGLCLGSPAVMIFRKGNEIHKVLLEENCFYMQFDKLRYEYTHEIPNMNSKEHSIDGINWNTVAILPGAGSTTQIQKYRTQHYSIDPVINYYRLNQFDFDGEYKPNSQKINEPNAAAFESVSFENNPAFKPGVEVTSGESDPVFNFQDGYNQKAQSIDNSVSAEVSHDEYYQNLFAPPAFKIQ